MELSHYDDATVTWSLQDQSQLLILIILMIRWSEPNPNKKMLIILREAIVQKIPFFYEILSQTGRGGQSDFISLIQK